MDESAIQDKILAVKGCKKEMRRVDGEKDNILLSPLLANIMLDDFDKELTRRGHKFVQFADDCNIYVKSFRAGQRVMASITKYLEERLRLQINRDKSAVDRPWKRKFLGPSFYIGKQVGIRLAP